MIFETLHSSAERGELLLIDGGMCHWHLRRDGQLTIREIISTRKGAGAHMLRRLEHTLGADSLFAKCPADLAANAWYARRGFHVARAERARSGRLLLHWRKAISNVARCPNVGGLEVIYCADGHRRFAEVAIDAGMLYGAQLPGTVYYAPYFADQDFKNPNRAAYMEALVDHRPHMATVLDWERWDQLDEVLAWAEEAAQHVEVVIIVPKVHGGIAYLPTTIAGKPVRLGYSVPTRYGGTPVQVAEFAAWEGDGVHLLGGSPEKQMGLYRTLGNVRSIDGNMAKKMAHRCMFWSLGLRSAKNPHWPSLSEAGGWVGLDANLEAFRRSCANIMQAWREVTQRPANGHFPAAQLHLWEPYEIPEDAA